MIDTRKDIFDEARTNVDIALKIDPELPVNMDDVHNYIEQTFPNPNKIKTALRYRMGKQCFAEIIPYVKDISAVWNQKFNPKNDNPYI